MDRQAQAGEPPRYRAFISYSHAEARFAGWLHARLESFRLPDGGRLAPIFIDRAELVAAPDLTAQVREAIAQSAALVVVASPAARASRWVAQEIALFRELHPERPVLAALREGEPGDAFPPNLLERNGEAIEPLAADFRRGRDGSRLALLKIAAGLSGLPLDRLVQRDAQARQRRVMAVTAAALLLSIVLAALLVMALRARAEAQRQRAEAEGMVEFMLTDLRDRLKGVGRLDVMDTVNRRAMQHYAGQDLSSLPDDSLTRRARLLHAMGEDDEKLGDYPAAVAKYREAHRITAAVLARRPRDPEAIFTHAQSEFWVGEAAWQLGDFKNTEIHWRNYLHEAEALAEVEPRTIRSLMELGYANGNLCELTARQTNEPARALPYCQHASDYMREALRLDPDNATTAMALANRLGWQADLLVDERRFDEGIVLREEEAALLDGILAKDPKNLQYRERRQWPEIGIGEALIRAGRNDDGAARLNRSLTAYDRLSAEMPDDTSLAERQLRIARLLARDALDRGHSDAPRFVALARKFYDRLRRTRTPAQMIRFDKMVASLQGGDKK